MTLETPLVLAVFQALLTFKQGASFIHMSVIMLLAQIPLRTVLAFECLGSATIGFYMLVVVVFDCKWFPTCIALIFASFVISARVIL